MPECTVCGGRYGLKYCEEIAKAPKGRRSMDVSDVVWVENDYNDNSKDSSRSIGSNSATNSTIENSGVLLADDMGLGKTLQVLPFSVDGVETNAVSSVEETV